MPLTLTTGECAALAQRIEAREVESVAAELLPRLKRAGTPRKGNAAGKRFERRIATEMREIVAQLPGEWKVARNQTDRH